MMNRNLESMTIMMRRRMTKATKTTMDIIRLQGMAPLMSMLTPTWFVAIIMISFLKCWKTPTWFPAMLNRGSNAFPKM